MDPGSFKIKIKIKLLVLTVTHEGRYQSVEKSLVNIIHVPKTSLKRPCSAEIHRCAASAMLAERTK
jgi:hypothetical protein